MAMLLVLSMTATTLAAGTDAAVGLNLLAESESGIVVLDVYLTAKNATNGRVVIDYDEQLVELVETRTVGTWVTSVNTAKEGEVAFAWVGSDLSATTEIVQMVFDVKVAKYVPATFSGEVTELYDNGTSLLDEVITDSVEVVVVPAGESGPSHPPVNPNPPVDPKPPVEDPDDGKDDEQDKDGIEIGIEIPELTEEKYESIVAQYTDIPQNWATDSIVKAVNAGLFNGTSDNTFSPEAKMTRAQLMTVLARLAGVDTTVGATWYEKGMEWSKENGISDGSNPSKNITRQELVTMLYRFAGEPATNGSLANFTDASSVSNYAVDAMKWAVENGIINGMGDGTLAPQGEATRAQMAKILMFFIEL